MTPAERTALQGLLLLLVEVQNQVGSVDFGDDDECMDAARSISGLVESPHAWEMIAAARAALTPPPNRQTFFAIVTQYDCSKKYREQPGYEAREDGPLVFEQHLNAHTAVRANLENKILDGAFREYGWAAIAEITVDIPVTPAAAIPADQAATHA